MERRCKLTNIRNETGYDTMTDSTDTKKIRKI